MPEGRRYSIRGNRIVWMEWSFIYGVKTTKGVQIYDAQFLNERIIYELSLQEISVFYSGMDPAFQSTIFHDSAFLLGKFKIDDLITFNIKK